MALSFRAMRLPEGVDQLRYWAAHPVVARMPCMDNMPWIASCTFDSHRAFDDTSTMPGF